RQDRADHGSTTVRHLAARPGSARGHPLRPPRDRLAQRRRRGRGVLPADRAGRWLPLPGRRHRHTRHARTAPDRGTRAHRAGARLDHGYQASVRDRSADDACAGERRRAAAVLLQDAVMQARFEAIEELEPGERWAAHFARHWPRYEAWFLQEGEAARTTYA